MKSPFKTPSDSKDKENYCEVIWMTIKKSSSQLKNTKNLNKAKSLINILQSKLDGIAANSKSPIELKEIINKDKKLVNIIVEIMAKLSIIEITDDKINIKLSEDEFDKFLSDEESKKKVITHIELT